VHYLTSTREQKSNGANIHVMSYGVLLIVTRNTDPTFWKMGKYELVRVNLDHGGFVTLPAHNWTGGLNLEYLNTRTICRNKCEKFYCSNSYIQTHQSSMTTGKTRFGHSRWLSGNKIHKICKLVVLFYFYELVSIFYNFQ
jgi:hypothetical protein